MHLEEVGVMVGVGLMAQAGTNDGHCLVHSSPPPPTPPSSDTQGLREI